VEESKYFRKNCFELIPVVVRQAQNDQVCVLQAPNTESARAWVECLEEQQVNVKRIIERRKK